jgi:RNA polymerase-binding transcription factor
MSPGYLNQYRHLLLAKQQELVAENVGRGGLPSAGGHSGGDVMDQAVAESEARIQARLHQVDSHLRRAVEEALSRISRGSYGVCIACKRPISTARLRAVPWTHLCRDCKETERPVLNASE